MCGVRDRESALLFHHHFSLSHKKPTLQEHLVAGMKDEIKVLFQQRDELSNTVKNLQGQKSTLLHEVDDLVKEKEKNSFKIG